MNNYLLQILKETKTIIIPGLGALTVTNETTGEIMFMSFLKHDDGNLARYISEKEGMDINDAKNMIAKFVREVMAELDKGETYDMYQFGKFQKVAGEIEFEQWSESSASTETPKVEEAPKTVEPTAKEVEEIPIDEPITDVVVPAVEIPVVEHHETPQAPIEPAVVKEETPKAEEPEVNIPEAFTEATAELEETPKVEEPKKEEQTQIEETSIPIPVPFAEEVKETPVVETPKAEVPPVIVPESGIEPDPIKEIHPEQAIPPAPKATPEIKKDSEKKDLRKPVGKSPKEKLKEADKKKDEQPKKKKTGALGYILWGIVVLVLGAGTYVAVQFDTLKKDFPILADLAGENETAADTTSLKTIGETDPSAHPDSMPKAEPIPGSETDATEEITEPEPEVVESKPEPKVEPKPVKKEKPVVKKTEPVVKPIPKPQPKPVSRPQTVSVYKPKPANFPTPNLNKPYHIIAGSFSSNTNARNFATKLKNMGMSNLSIGEKDGLYKVSINGYNTEEEAKAAVPSVQSVAPGAWVFKWN